MRPATGREKGGLGDLSRCSTVVLPCLPSRTHGRAHPRSDQEVSVWRLLRDVDQVQRVTHAELIEEPRRLAATKALGELKHGQGRCLHVFVLILIVIAVEVGVEEVDDGPRGGTDSVLADRRRRPWRALCTVALRLLQQLELRLGLRLKTYKDDNFRRKKS